MEVCLNQSSETDDDDLQVAVGSEFAFAHLEMTEVYAHIRPRSSWQVAAANSLMIFSSGIALVMKSIRHQPSEV